MHVSSTNHINELGRRLYTYHIPRAIAEPVAKCIMDWTEKSGEEWTVKRLKALKTDFIRLLAGKSPSSTWVKYKKNLPMGPFGALFAFGLSPKADSKRVVRVLNALMAYSMFQAEKVTKTQLKKFYGSIASPALPSTVVEEVFSKILPLSKDLRVRTFSLDTTRDYIPSPSRFCPTSEGRSIPEEQWLETIDIVWNNALGFDLYHKYSQLREVLEDFTYVIRGHIAHIPTFITECDGDEYHAIGFAGKIGHIQEPGFKLRAVANPHRVYQLSLSRLGKQLYELLKRLPWDCTHDQESGSVWAVQEMAQNKEMFAVDLSDATNQFPLELQLKVLQSIPGIVEEDIHLFNDLSTANWLSPTHGLVSWRKGQPLGLLPSFASFALTHGLLLVSLERELGLSEGENFRVLGDDVVISDKTLYDAYREVLAKLEVSVSEDKTIISKVLTEFGGKVIFQGNIMSLAKWRKSSDRNFLDVVANVGPRYLQYLQPRQRKVAEILITLPRPFGLGMNPRGLSAETRWEIEELCNKFLDKSEYELPQFGRNSLWHSVAKAPKLASVVFSPAYVLGYYNLDGSLKSDNFTGDRSTRPVHSEEVLCRISYLTGVPIQPSTQFKDLHPYPDLLERIRKVARELKLKRFMPSGDPRGTTTLVLWEKRIKSVLSKV